LGHDTDLCACIVDLDARPCSRAGYLLRERCAGEAMDRFVEQSVHIAMRGEERILRLRAYRIRQD